MVSLDLEWEEKFVNRWQGMFAQAWYHYQASYDYFDTPHPDDISLEFATATSRSVLAGDR